jgi:thiol:disulfide interchange protein
MNIQRSWFSFAFVFLISPFVLFGQRLDPIQWTLSTKATRAAPGATLPLQLTAKMQEGWHLYSLTTPRGGPIPTTVALAENPAVKRSVLYQPKPLRKFDPNFNLDTETFGEEAVFLISAQLNGDAPIGELGLTAAVRYQACSDRQCLPPRRKQVLLTLTVAHDAPMPAALVVPSDYSEVGPGGTAKTAAASSEAEKPASGTDRGLLLFMLTAFGLGLAAVFTPCVFPMIPVTVSFFMGGRGGMKHAAIFALGIIALFSALGLGITAAVGPFGVVRMGASPWVNGFIAAVFGVFALSLLGAFEITLPAGMLTTLDQASRRGGYIGTLIMGLTFSLTSFACVGPFVGSLLAASAQTHGAQPVLGMMAFAGGLASPFFFLAAFPSYLKKLPRNGEWMMRVKVVMGFVLLAALFKYLSNVDQALQLGILTRERFLAAWFILFGMAGLYLLGFLGLEGIERGARLGIGRLLTANAFLIFAFSLVPGMFGANMGELEAYVPASTSSTDLPGSGGQSDNSRLTYMKNQYPEALAKAREENRPVLVIFTGYACTNCHWMKANLFNRPEIAARMKDFVLVDLYTDGTDTSSEKNQEMESARYDTVAIPFYAIVDADGKTISTFAGLTRDPAEWQNFLNKAVSPGI